MEQDTRIVRGQDLHAQALSDFQRAMAMETEGRELDRETVAAGVRNLLENPERGFYLVAVSRGSAVGSLMVTTEWSDWRDGFFWWIQSVYVKGEFRRKGVYRRLHESVLEMARKAPDVCGIRLYVDRRNSVAQDTYRSLGMQETDYLLFEHSF
jgi:ribosomal protein S18 acetylase RimI-like enzyme